MTVELMEGDCLELMQDIPDKSVDMILCDLPYGTTQNKWDSLIPLDSLWIQYKRIIKEKGVICLTAQSPFDKVLGCSNLPMLKYEWIWDKKKPTGFLNAKKMPMKQHENILVFYKKLPTYNPIPYNKNTSNRFGKSKSHQSSNYGEYCDIRNSSNGKDNGYPRSIINSIPVMNNLNKEDKGGLHPTQKPVALFEYLIKTYTNEDDLILDNCAGSGTTGVAAINLNRNAILIEKEPEYCKIIRERLKDNQKILDIEEGIQKVLI
jgi:DNA modification methylase